MTGPPAALVDEARRSAGEAETARRLPAGLVGQLRDAGAFRLCVPRRLGGAEAAPATVLRWIESISTGDGSAGWCVMIGATTGLLAGWLSTEGADEVFGDPAGIAGGVVAPRGEAEAVDGGWRVSGRWPFASGCQHSDWLTASVPAGGLPVNVFFPAAEVTIVDTWTVSGLRGTGSHDIEVREAFVPERRAATIWAGEPVEKGSLYAFPVIALLAAAVAAVALGVARAALDEVVRAAGEKKPTGSSGLLAERALFHHDLARAEAGLRSARAWLYATVEETSAALSEESPLVTTDQRALVRLAATRATWAAVEAVDMAYSAGGGTSLYAQSPLQRQFRDVHAITQHITVGPATWELAGRVLAGQDLGGRVL